MKHPVFQLTSLLLLSLGLATAAEDKAALKFFETEIRPLLSAECYDCHGPEKAKAGLRLDHIEHIIAGGDTGPAIVAGKPEESLLVEAIHRTDPDFEMPPKKALEDKQVAVLEEWIRIGAPWPEEKATRVERDEDGFTTEDRNWWAIQPLAEVTPPDAGSDWARNEIDPFIHRGLERDKLRPADPAGPVEMIRRLHFDLHGLPPTPEVVDSFTEAYLADPDAAVAAEVDRLLASPRYGERWGQHWLDVVRYSESDGYRADGYRPDSWRYRDYVIQSFNEDKPYDRFIREQIAGDELYGDDPDSVIGTAFLRHGVYEWNQRNARMQWDLILTEMTNVTSEAFLGLGMGCAQCHDHKFDPILQKDYFALQAFLNTTWWPEDATLATPEDRAAHDKQLAEWKEATAPIRARLDELKQPRIESNIRSVVKQFPADVQEIYRKPAAERTAHEEQLAQLVQRQVDHKQRRIDWDKEFAKKEDIAPVYAELKKKLAESDHLKPKELPTAFITTDVKLEPAVTAFEKRGDEVPVEPAFLTLLDEPAPEIEPTGSTTGRRTALAEWIASEDNPLTARVFVNRIWQHHFGNGLVPTPNDFGQLGEEPSHPELLDWLTTRFLEEEWRMKPIHRLVLNSAAYRQTAQREPTSVERITDPGNRLLWRFPPRRLDAEQIRDAMLASSGELQHRDGGSSVDGNKPNRSIFVRKKRNTRDPMIGAFDAPTGFSSAPTRISTTTPNQSLLLVNGEWAMKRAAAFARRVLADRKEVDAEAIRDAYRIAYGREPLTAEVEGALEFVRAQVEVIKTTPPENDDPPKYPDENGLRPIDQVFAEVKSLTPGERALWLQPGSRFERLEIAGVDQPDEKFSVEVVANLDSLYPDASVRTLAARWNGSHGQTGWSLGVTSEKSGYQPRNLIVQLVGDDFQGNRIYEVVASGLRVPLQAPVFIAAAISAVPSEDDPTKGSITFYLKDLSDPKAPLQTETIPHQIVGGMDDSAAVPLLVGGREQKGHRWDGQVARLRIQPGLVSAEHLLLGKKPAEKTLADLAFSGTDGETPAPETAWRRQPVSSSSRPTGLHAAMTDFCHALLNSNEFLYLH